MIIVDEKELRKQGISTRMVEKIKSTSSPSLVNQSLVNQSLVNQSQIDKSISLNIKATSELAVAIHDLAANKSNPEMKVIAETLQSIQEFHLDVLNLLEKKMQPSKSKVYEFIIGRNKQGTISKIHAKEKVV